MNKLKTLFIAIFAVAASLAPVAAPAVVMAADGDIQSGLCGGASLSAPGTPEDCDNINEEASQGVNDTVNLIINIFSWVVGVVSVIMIIWGGFKYITSAGDAGSVTAAKNTILYAIVGLIIVALAQVIVKFVLGNVTQS